ncbi:MAG: TIGR02678 family protein [Lachnospiraceae bacterium]|nr:TIGR02678 family protein [Lachnospiraceae bacterium]
MNEIVTLLENYWVCREQDREQYNRVKKDIPKFQKFIREQLGWKLLSNEHMLKLEKIPAHAESFMGIQEFQDIRDYAILCIVLMFLEDKEEQEQFLLSELISYTGVQLQKWMEVDWNSFSQRKSMVRVLQYAERLSMLRVYDGNSERLSQEIGQEVLYENTGLSRYFATGFPFDLKEYSGWRDFEKEPLEELEADRGHVRVNRVYRRLTACPAMYWENNEDADSLYLKNQRQWVEKYMEENLGGRLDIHRNAAFWVLGEAEHYGSIHPREAQLPEVVLLLGGLIREKTEQGILEPGSDGKIKLSREAFAGLLMECRENWREAWSKEYREMEDGRLAAAVEKYMRDWMMLEEDDGQLLLCQAAAKQFGFYPPDYQNTGEKSR